jgi:hypothetical protein
VDPELVEQEAPLEAVLVVAEPSGDEVRFASVKRGTTGAWSTKREARRSLVSSLGSSATTRPSIGQAATIEA